MRKTPTLLFFVLMAMVSQAQDMLVQDKQWYTVLSHWWIPNYHTERFYRIDGDTIINNQTYKTLSYNTEYTTPEWIRLDTFLREDDQKVVYMLGSSGQEGILYDLDMQPGEEIVLQNGTIARYEKERMVDYYGVLRREVQVLIMTPDSSCYDWIWLVEGIGGRNALFPGSCQPMSEGFVYSINCVSVGQQVLYPGTPNFCIFFTTGTRDIQTLPFEAYPNPVTDQLTIRLTESSETEMYISLCNLQGQVIHAQNTSTPYQEMDMSPWPSGMYILRVQSSSGGEGFRKLVKL